MGQLKLKTGKRLKNTTKNRMKTKLLIPYLKQHKLGFFIWTFHVSPLSLSFYVFFSSF